MPNGFAFNPMFARAMTCPTYGYMPTGAQMMGGPWMGGTAMGWQMGFPYGMPPQMGPWFGGPMTWGGTFPRRYPGLGWAYPPTPSDEQIAEMIYDAIDADPVIPFDSDINVKVAAGGVTLSGTVPNKRIKHAAGDDAWWIPGVWDVNNNLQIVGRRKAAGAPGPRATTRPT